MVQAIGPDIHAVRLIRDRDGIYGAAFDKRVSRFGLEQVRIAPRSPWQNGYAERFVGTLRRELLDHVVVLGQRHLLRLVRDHARYYNNDRPHMSLSGEGDLPAQGRRAASPVCPPSRMTTRELFAATRCESTRTPCMRHSLPCDRVGSSAASTAQRPASRKPRRDLNTIGGGCVL
jgi:hypothetical protein